MEILLVGDTLHEEGDSHVSPCSTSGFFFFNGVCLLSILLATCDSVRNGNKNAKVLFYISFKIYYHFISMWFFILGNLQDLSYF